MTLMISSAHELQNELARGFRHEGIRVGEITAYRARRAIEPTWLRNADDRLHSVYVQDYVWPLVAMSEHTESTRSAT